MRSASGSSGIFDKLNGGDVLQRRMPLRELDNSLRKRRTPMSKSQRRASGTKVQLHSEGAAEPRSGVVRVGTVVILEHRIVAAIAEQCAAKLPYLAMYRPCLRAC